MCDPVTMGVASFAQGAVSAVGAGQQASAANKQALNNYEYQLQKREHDWKAKLNIWANQRLEYDKTVSSNGLAAGRAYAAEQEKLNDAVRTALFASEKNRTDYLSKAGNVAASGRTGRTAARLQNAQIAAFGRNQAVLAENVVSSRNALRTANEGIRLQQQSANNDAFNQVAMRPVQGIAPPKPQLQNPSNVMMMGMANAALSGFSAYAGAKAPPATVPGPTPPAAPTPGLSPVSSLSSSSRLHPNDENC